MPTYPVPQILGDAEFETYSIRWANYVVAPGLAAFNYDPVSGSKYTSVSFLLTSIGSMLSTVGATHINARLLGDTNGRFTVALYAADENNNPLSAYYTPEKHWTVPLSSSDTAKSISGLVPNGMAQSWLDNWANTSSLTAANFNPGFGPLLGYRFRLEDFLKPLLAATDYQTQILGVNLGMHQYYPKNVQFLNGVAQPVNIFGLVLRVYDAGGPIPLTDDIADDIAQEGFYDLSMPSPPH